MKTTSAVYVIRHSVSGKVYVGSSCNIDARLKQHKAQLARGNHHNCLLQRTWNKCVPANFSFEILEFVARENLIASEQRWMDQLGAADRARGFNLMSKAGGVAGIYWSEAARDARQKAMLGRPGWKWSADQKAAQSKRAKGRPCTEGQRRILLANRATPEQAARGGRAQRGRPKPPHIGPLITARNKERKAHLILFEVTRERGLSSPNQRLPVGCLPDLRRMSTEGMSCPEIAKIYGVNRSTISRALRGTTHAQNPRMHI